MSKNVIIAGGTGMVGSLILMQCIADNNITSIISFVRKPTVTNHPKVTEVCVNNFSNYEKHLSYFSNIDLAFFCIGAYTGTLPDADFKIVTYDYAVAFADALNKQSPKANFCFLSGQGADRTEKSKLSFAKYKGMAENYIINKHKNFYSFRPGYIYPVTKRNEPNFFYKISRAIYPFLKLLGKNRSITSVQLAMGMMHVAQNGFIKPILENKDIRAIDN